MNSVVEANRATLAAFGFGSRHNGESDGELDRESDRELGPEADHYSESGRYSEPDQYTVTDQYTESDWSFERSIEAPDELRVGDTVTFTKSIDDEDIRAFARASGDTNPLHLDDEFAEKTRFGGRIAHGTLVSGVISAALARIPGQVIYLSQEVHYLNPVRPGESVTAVVEVTEVLDRGRYRLATEIDDEDGRAVIEGEAVVLVEALPEEEADAD